MKADCISMASVVTGTISYDKFSQVMMALDKTTVMDSQMDGTHLHFEGEIGHAAKMFGDASCDYAKEVDWISGIPLQVHGRFRPLEVPQTIAMMSEMKAAADPTLLADADPARQTFLPPPDSSIQEPPGVPNPWGGACDHRFPPYSSWTRSTTKAEGCMGSTTHAGAAQQLCFASYVAKLSG